MSKWFMGDSAGQFMPWLKLCPSRQGLTSTRCFKCQKERMCTGNMRGLFLCGDWYSLLTYTSNNSPHRRWTSDTLELSGCWVWAERHQWPTSGNSSSTPSLPLSPVSPTSFHLVIGLAGKLNCHFQTLLGHFSSIKCSWRFLAKKFWKAPASQQWCQPTTFLVLWNQHFHLLLPWKVGQNLETRSYIQSLL